MMKRHFFKPRPSAALKRMRQREFTPMGMERCKCDLVDDSAICAKCGLLRETPKENG
jgi:hypothetical protein